jgi:hypothetical protein
MILNRISTLQGKPNTHAWNIQRSFRSNRLPLIPGRGSGPPQATVGPYAHQLCRTYVCSATTRSRIPICLAEYTPARRCMRKTKLRVVGGMSTCRADWLLGLLLYHISRHVASTFKRLATTTTPFDLNHFYQNRQGNPPGHDTTHDPVHHPCSGCRIINKHFLYRASVRKSLVFYRSY